MKLPKDLKDVIQHCLENLKSRPQEFTFLDRYNIYKTFGSSKLLEELAPALVEDLLKKSEGGNNNKILPNLFFADYVLCWLAIITVQHVLPIWEQNDFDSASYIYDRNKLITPHFILQTMENLLNRKISLNDAYTLYHSYFPDGMDKVENYINYNTQSVYWAAYKALYVVFYGYYGRIANDKDEEEDLIAKEELGWGFWQQRPRYDEGGEDFAAEAMLAYAAIDPNQPGDWQHIKGYNNLFTMRTSDRKESLQNIEINQDKRLEPVLKGSSEAPMVTAKQ